MTSVADDGGASSDEPKAASSRPDGTKSGDAKPEDTNAKDTNAKDTNSKDTAKKHSKHHGKKANRLAKEKSPYLLQHAYNPVDWYPWGKEAFDRAKKENKPVFLSIGYSTCHWCHVMERESFENEDIAEYMNKYFVCIKVDREERPDVDGIYMDAVQVMTGRGGWPLSAFLLPDGKPFFTGTYFPPENFTRLMNRITEVWNDEKLRPQIVEQAGKIVEHLQAQAESGALPAGGKIGPEVADKAFVWYERAHDARFGGFGSEPKFPRTSNLDFLMRYALRTGKKEALDIVYNTLDHMIRGGMYDQLRGGFHRYSVDRHWLVPHFEKMLYDNALISRTLVEAYQISGKESYLRVARECLDYLIEQMQDSAGGFYSAEDADTDGHEGLTYVWTRAEILEALGDERGKVFADYYGVQEKGNFSEPRQTHESKESVVHITLKGGEAELAKNLGRPLEEVQRELAADRAKLMLIREKRSQPFLDDKVLVEWNGLAISAFAKLYQVTEERRYLEAAQKAAGFILDRMVIDGVLHRRYRAGGVAIKGFLEDYAFFVDALIDLYESDFDSRWLEASVRLGRASVELFWDPKGGDFFASAGHHEELITKRKEHYDGAVPSGNSVAFANLLRLKEITGDKFFDEPIAKFQASIAVRIDASPQTMPQHLCALEFLLQEPREICIVGAKDDPVTQSMLKELRRRFIPSKVVFYAPDDKSAAELAKLVPLMEYKAALKGKPTAYVCRAQICKLPAPDLATLKKQLDAK